MTSIDRASLASLLALSTALLGGCDHHDGVRICGDGHGRRRPDRACAAGDGWIYIRDGKAPSVGGAITEGTRVPEEGVRYGAAPEHGTGGEGGTPNHGGED